MQYIWQHRLYRNSDMVTNDGLKVRVIDPGLLNTDAGPDFFNAKIEIDGHLWAGTVELHALAPAGQAQRLAAASRGSALRAGGQERPALARAVQRRPGAVERLARATIFHGCLGASAPPGSRARVVAMYKTPCPHIKKEHAAAWMFNYLCLHLQCYRN